MTTKLCSNCGKEKPLSEFFAQPARKTRPAPKHPAVGERARYRSSCRSCHRDRNKARSLARYGLTPESFEHLLEAQSGVCALCGKPEPVANRTLALDHDHATGKLRGLLCTGCNRRLGWYEQVRGRYENYLSSRNGRISRDDMLMEIAFLVAQRGTCERARVGAIIARNGRIISSGYVGSPEGQAHCIDPGIGCKLGTHNGCVRTIHAEANAVSYAAREGNSTKSAELFCSLSPCEPCSKLIISAGIRRVVYAARYRDETGIDLLRAADIEVVQWS